jgi:hypothetical protein
LTWFNICRQTLTKSDVALKYTQPKLRGNSIETTDCGHPLFESTKPTETVRNLKIRKQGQQKVVGGAKGCRDSFVL